MFKDLIGFSLIIMGVFSLLNFISHHTGLPVNEKDYHEFVGILLIVGGTLVIKTEFKLDGWNLFKK